MEKRTLLLMLFLVCFCVNATAQLAITEPETVYHLGDRIYVTATGLFGHEEGNLNIDLVCGNTTVNFLKISARAFSPDGGQSYSIPYKILTREDLEVKNLNGIIGSCTIRANLASEIVESPPFTITSDVQVHASVDKVQYNPGDTMQFTLEATRADGAAFVGSYETQNFTDIEGTLTSEDSGTIVREIVIPQNTPAGTYFLKVHVFDTDTKGRVLNNGSFDVLVIINQVATAIEPTISAQQINPGETLLLNPTIVDQVGTPMPGLVTVYVTDPDGTKYDYSVTSGQQIALPLPSNATKGIWNVYLVHHDMKQDITFEILGLERINYSLTNSLLTITNIGNIEYFGIVTVAIGESTEEIELRLGPGASKEFVLEAPEGNYDIMLNDGIHEFSGTSFLTGNAVRVKERGGIITGSVSLMWIFLLFLGGSLIVVSVGMYKRGKQSQKTSFTEKVKDGFDGFKKITKRPAESQPVKKDTRLNIVPQGRRTLSAESSLVVDGEKTESSVVAISLKDTDSFSQEIQHELMHIITRNCGPKGVVDSTKDIVYLIYSPLISRSYKNEYLATSVAMTIADELKRYTKNLKGELKLGIGVHSGFLVSQRVGQKLRYTSIGNTLSLASKMAEMADGTVHVSDVVRKRLVREIVVRQTGMVHDQKVYAVEKVHSKQADAAKLQDLLRRMQWDKKE